MIRAIAAIDDKRGIAKGGIIPWDLPDDKAYYRAKVANSVIIMGRGTYEAKLGPLSSRHNLVASRSLTSLRPGFELLTDVDEYLQQAKEDVWILGGSGLYQSTLKYCDEIYLTHVEGDFGCDRFFPEYPGFHLIERSPEHEQNGYKFHFAAYAKNR